MGEKPHRCCQSLCDDRDALFRQTPYSLEARLVAAIEQGDKTLSLETLEEINRHGSIAVLAEDPLRSAKNTAICSSAFLARAAIRAGVWAEEAFTLSDAIICHIEGLNHAQAATDYKQETVLQFIELVKRKKGKEYSPLIMSALRVIRSELGGKITLRDVAERVGVHPTHLSRRFRQETGQTITAYINRCKVEESIWFVCNTTHSMAEIADLYGFSNQAYYITVFRQCLGITPGELAAVSAEKNLYSIHRKLHQS